MLVVEKPAAWNFMLFIRIKATLEKAFPLPDPISLSLPLWPALKHYTQ